MSLSLFLSSHPLLPRPLSCRLHPLFFRVYLNSFYLLPSSSSPLSSQKRRFHLSMRIQVIRMISAFRAMCRIPHRANTSVRRLTQITELSAAFTTSHVIAPRRFLYISTTPLPRTLFRLFLEILFILRILIFCFSTRDAVIVLIAGLAIMPFAPVSKTLSVSAACAFHKRTLGVWGVFLAKVAVGGETPGEVLEGADGAAEGESVIGDECGWGGGETHFGVREGGGAFGAVDSLPAV